MCKNRTLEAQLELLSHSKDSKLCSFFPVEVYEALHDAHLILNFYCLCNTAILGYIEHLGDFYIARQMKNSICKRVAKQVTNLHLEQTIGTYCTSNDLRKRSETIHLWGYNHETIGHYKNTSCRRSFSHRRQQGCSVVYEIELRLRTTRLTHRKFEMQNSLFTAYFKIANYPEQDKK